jgi:hypothetical protein
MITPPRDPAGEYDCLAGMLGAEFSRRMGAKHVDPFQSVQVKRPDPM